MTIEKSSDVWVGRTSGENEDKLEENLGEESEAWNLYVM